MDNTNRPEFDAGENRALLAVAEDWDTPESMLEYLEDGFGATARNDGLFTPEEIEHARKVLARLTALENGGSE